MPTVDPSELMAQLRELNADPAAIAGLPPEVRRTLSTIAQETSHRLETPTETLARLLLCQPVEGTCVRVATDLQLFAILSDVTEPESLKTLAEVTKADSVLLYRLLRYLIAVHAVDQDESGIFSMSTAYSALANRSHAEACGPCYDALGKIQHSTPHYLASAKYKNPSNPNATSVQKAYRVPDTPFMDILQQHPQQLQGFATLMNAWADSFSQIENVYPVQSKLIDGFDESASDVMLLDIGGGYGQKSVAFKRAFPQLPGRVIVQDLPSVIDKAPKKSNSYEGIEMTVHDLTTEQPIKSARCYHIRQCLHNWTDEKSVLILEKISEAMKRGYSKLLIHEIIVPERDAGTWVTAQGVTAQGVTAQDMEMLAMFATCERTRVQWEDLCTRAGLRVSAVYLDGHPSCEGIIEVINQ